MDKGIKFGRKPHTASEKALKEIRKGIPAKEVMESAGISLATYFRIRKAA